MSRTRKHQLIYDAMHDRGTWPFSWFAMGIECRRATFFHRASNRQARHRAKQLIKKGLYTEAKHVKPRNVDWDIW